MREWCEIDLALTARVEHETSETLSDTTIYIIS